MLSKYRTMSMTEKPELNKINFNDNFSDYTATLIT